MSKVFLYKGENENSIRCKGHATGRSDVCSAISMICCTLANSLEHYNVRREIILKEGLAEFTFERTTESDVLYEFMRIGFESLKRKYPDVVQIDDVNR